LITASGKVITICRRPEGGGILELKLDTTKTYAIALEGGGARGAYEVGVWKALDEAGIKYNAVSGTSVGALNGALMAMRDLERAVDIWSNICFSQVMAVDDEEMRKFFRMELGLGDLKTFVKRVVELIKSRGFDVSPLRKWIGEVADENVVRRSDVDFYITTYSITDRKSLELRASELEDGQLCDMLLASAYLPTFRNEKLGGKRYTDGGIQDAVPVHSLVANGYKDIIVVRLYGMGVVRRFKMPEDVRLTTIAPTAALGSVLNFDREQSLRNLTLGYYDAKRVLYGLYGTDYYLERTLSESEAYELLREFIGQYIETLSRDITLRDLNEKILPEVAKNLGVKGDYYNLLIACMERLAKGLNLPAFRIIKDTELLEEFRSKIGTSRRALVRAVSYVARKKPRISVLLP